MIRVSDINFGVFLLLLSFLFFAEPDQSQDQKEIKTRSFNIKYAMHNFNPGHSDRFDVFCPLKLHIPENELWPDG
jgi:hypothetical protein